MLQQFRRAIGCDETVPGQAKLILGRLHRGQQWSGSREGYVDQTIVTTDGRQVSKEGMYGSIIIRAAGEYNTQHTNNSGLYASLNMRPGDWK